MHYVQISLFEPPTIEKELYRPLKYGKNFLSLKISLPTLVQMPLQGGIHDMYIPLQKEHTHLNYAMK
jgi:hypothetical protein